jgi:hypothetical protein
MKPRRSGETGEDREVPRQKQKSGVLQLNTGSVALFVSDY